MQRIFFQLFPLSLFLFSCNNASKQVQVEKTKDKLANDLSEFELYKSEVVNFLKESSQSPFIKDGVNTFQKLYYFNYDTNYAVSYKLDTSDSVRLNMDELANKSGQMNYQKMGVLHFLINTTECSLQFYYSKEFDEYFIPFHDLTNGRTTYSGGRYISWHRGKLPKKLNFNYAYNPYCHYNDNFMCPIIPKRNKLNIQIQAGEQLCSVE